jgi:hypothetical protein
MAEDTTQVPGDQTTSASSAGASSQVPMVEKSRLDNAMAKIQELTLANRALADENTQLKSSKGQLEAKVVTAASEMEAKTAEFNSKITELTSKEAEYLAKQGAHQSLERKLKAIKEIGAPQLISIIDVLPSAETDEAQIEAIKSIAEFAKAEAKARESQLTAGLTKTIVTPAGSGEKFETSEDWEKAIDAAPLGSEKRQNLMDGWFAYLNKR